MQRGKENSQFEKLMSYAQSMLFMRERVNFKFYIRHTFFASLDLRFRSKMKFWLQCVFTNVAGLGGQ